MNTPDISFIMPCYKDAKTLEIAVNSILDQDWKNLEVIVVNDGSPDEANEILDRLEKQDERVKTIRFKKNKGACEARNAGAAISKGRYLSFLPADAFLYPGNVRVWVETLDAHPDNDFLYGGYRFVKELSPHGGESVMDYKSEMFDPYQLEVGNYIDGSFPMRKEVFFKVGGWSEDVKSLQDWDLWLKIVRSDSKGIFFADLFFETEMPHQGGLSFDSAANWLERLTYIKKKNGIPIRKNCVASMGAGWHAKNIAKMLDADFKEMPSFKPHEYEAIYVIGFYPQFADMQGAMFFNNYNNPNEGTSPAKKIIHLVGTDIWQLKALSALQLEFYRNYFRSNIDVILCEDKFTQDELKELKIDAEVVPIPPKKIYPLMDLPKEFSVAIYMPQTNKDFYRPDLMIQTAKALPDIKFKFFGDQYQRGVDGNIEYMGYLQEAEVDDLIKNTSCLLRMPIHDGLSLNSLEFLLAGRNVISSTPIKHSIYIEEPDQDSIIKGIKMAQEAGQNVTGSKYWRSRLSHKKYVKKIQELCTYQPTNYWENRAKSWDKQAGDNFPDLAELEPLFLEIKPQTVLDIGCGSGRWYPYFAKQGVDYRGFDISHNLVAMAQQKFPEGKFQACKVEDIPVPPKVFDLGFSYTVLEHITEEEFPKAVEALKKSCRKLILVEPVNFPSRHYCHDHAYEQHFNVVKKVLLKDKVIFLIDNES